MLNVLEILISLGIEGTWRERFLHMFSRCFLLLFQVIGLEVRNGDLVGNRLLIHALQAWRVHLCRGRLLLWFIHGIFHEGRGPSCSLPQLPAFGIGGEGLQLVHLRRDKHFVGLAIEASAPRLRRRFGPSLRLDLLHVKLIISFVSPKVL